MSPKTYLSDQLEQYAKSGWPIAKRILCVIYGHDWRLVRPIRGDRDPYYACARCPAERPTE